MVDSGASVHMVSQKDLESAELETMRTSRNPTTVLTANGELQTREEPTEYVKELDLFLTVMLLEETPEVLSLGKLCEDHGKTYHWTSGLKNTSHPIRARELIAKYQTLCQSLIVVCRRVPQHHPHLLLRHLHRRIRHIHRRTLNLTSADTWKIPQPKEVEVRERSYEETRCIDKQKPRTPLKKEGHEEVQSDLLHDLPYWLQEFRENLVGER